jgi:hypothetical protein
MKKAIITVSLIGSLLLVLDSANAAHWLVLFLLAGVVPGTDILISPVDMLAANATAITAIILYVTVWPTIRNLIFSRPAAPIASKKHTARHRTAH